MMELASLEFAAFFALSLAVYYLAPRRAQWVVLLAFSGAFFMLSSPWYTSAYLVACMLVTGFCVSAIARCRERRDPGGARRCLVAGVLADVAMLAVLKYSGFFIGNVNKLMHLAGTGLSLPGLGLEAPIGISFYTFSAIGYLLDVYWGKSMPLGGIVKSCLFVGYYPLLTSGPIVRSSEMPPLYEGHRFNGTAVMFGLERMLWGVFKKLVVATRLGVIVDAIYLSPEIYDGLYVWVAAAFFSLQLYTDFSGCMDIVIGASECYGIKLPENFRSPFFSRNVQEFWQRWHITLGSWMRDYVLYPLLKSNAWRALGKRLRARFGKKAAKQVPAYLGMFCVWLLMGLWHGGGWNYVLGMGVWFSSCIILGQAIKPQLAKAARALKVNCECFSWRLFQSLRVFFLVSIGLIFFRLPSLGAALREMALGVSCWNPWVLVDGSLYDLGLSAIDFRLMIVALLVVLVVSVLQERGSVREMLAGQNIVFRWAVLFLLVFSVVIFGQYGYGFDAQAFIYQGF